MKLWNRLAPKRWHRIAVLVALIAAVAVFLLPRVWNSLFEGYGSLTRANLHFDSVQKLNVQEFEALASELIFESARKQAAGNGEDPQDPSSRMKTNLLVRTRSFQRAAGFKHIEIFRKAGILSYEGPSTCLQCHATMRIQDHLGAVKEVRTMEDVTGSVHFRFQWLASGFSTHGFDGKEVAPEGSFPIPVGKIDRACGIPGSFSWNGWATLVETKPEGSGGATVMRSEGCGQCHIGGGYHPATERMMPSNDIPPATEQGIDCLICHSRSYDMNYRYVVEDSNGTRWNQDRTMRAAMTVGMPASENCLFCHQHNMGGDLYPQSAAAQQLGHKNQRFQQVGARSGSPWHASNDVHAAAGVQCLDCHQPQGHKIPRGNKGTGLVANDLPGVDVSCEHCHTAAPHLAGPAKALLNGHSAKLACETCHIQEPEPYNLVLRDWVLPQWNASTGVWEPTNLLPEGTPGKGFTFLWFNGNGTFLANALGTNPSNPSGYNPLMEQMVHLNSEELRTLLAPELERLASQYSFDKEAYLRDLTDTLNRMPESMLERRRQVLREKFAPLMAAGKSRIYPFKLFNARMFEDTTNQGPFGAMILPIDYKTYYQTGKPAEAVKAAMANPNVRKMYEAPFKASDLREFFSYFGVDDWKQSYPLQDGS
ncbi:MAG: hypothetical protein U5J83_15245 [Bryobacterales bacterium]|nr:hypothetical protein [Bryobacterales bacterium]